MNWQSLSVKQVVEIQNTDEKNGLSEKEAEARKRKYGKNALNVKKKKGFFRKFIEQLSDFMVIVLIIAAAISFITAFFEESGDFVDPIIILCIVIINAIVGIIQESKAEKAIEALQKMAAPESMVKRNGKMRKIPSDDLVPGDILYLEAGDMVPADARLIEAHGLKSEESALTGESFPVEKYAEISCKDDDAVGDMRNMVFASASIVAGNATAVVVETGMNSQMGHIASMLNENENTQTPLQQRLAATGKTLGIAALIICAGIFLLGLIQQMPPLEMFMISVSLAVAAIPEGLPAVVTIVLAFGVRRMAQKKAIIRRLPAVETLGSANIICSDKTGTLTQNKMTVTEISNADGVIGHGSSDEKLLLECMALCNNAVVTDEKGKMNITGDPTETALITAAIESGIALNTVRTKLPRIKEIPFDSVRKRMLTVHKISSGGYRIIVKGAPEQVIQRCGSFHIGGNIKEADASFRKRAEMENERMAADALRVLAVAYRDTDRLPSNLNDLEMGLTFIGFCGMIDPPRPQVKEAVRICRRAGIRPIMITGDHAVTAAAIARNIGIMQSGETVLTGSEIDKLNEREFEEKIRKCAVFARVTPEHKLKIVKAFQSQGNVVAMTGDGVNDAPALKAADIGCAMGENGTEVAKGAADMILTDDNFTTIVTAVAEGRGIYDNIKKAVHFLLSSNIGEIITVFSAFLLKLPSPLLAIQLLWVNLVTDSLPALALGSEPQEDDVMQRKAVTQSKGLFSGGLWYRIVIEGMLIGSLALLAFVIGKTQFDLIGEPTVGRTMAFAVLSISQLVHAFNMRSEKSLFKIGFATNPKLVSAFFICLLMQISVITVPPLASVFNTAPLNTVQWIIVAALSIVPLIAVEIEKALCTKRTRNEKI